MVEGLLIPIFWILWISGIGSESPRQYCGGNKLLDTQYFSSYIAKEEKSVGCVGSSLPAPQSTLHVLRLLKPDKEVYFTIYGKKDVKTKTNYLLSKIRELQGKTEHFSRKFTLPRGFETFLVNISSRA